MDNLIKKNINKLNSLKNRYIKLDKSLIDNFKKRLILYDDINSKLNEIEELMNNFEVNDCNLELQRRIESKKINEELINMLSPYIIIFILNKIDYI